jgi:hypothetical protein
MAFKNLSMLAILLKQIVSRAHEEIIKDNHYPYVSRTTPDDSQPGYFSKTHIELFEVG